MESSPSVGKAMAPQVMEGYAGSCGDSLVGSMQFCVTLAGATSAQACPPQAGGEPLSHAGHFQSTWDSCVSYNI